jgi:hypothetical protein
MLFVTRHARVERLIAAVPDVGFCAEQGERRRDAQYKKSSRHYGNNYQTKRYRSQSFAFLAPGAASRGWGRRRFTARRAELRPLFHFRSAFFTEHISVLPRNFSIWISSSLTLKLIIVSRNERLCSAFAGIVDMTIAQPRPLSEAARAPRKGAHPPLGRPFQYFYEFDLPGI